MVVKQYPHFLFAMLPSEESVQDENGNWSESTETTQLMSICREETNGSGNELKAGGGLFYKYSSLIQMPKDAPEIDEGAAIFVSNDIEGQDVRITGKVLKFDKGQLQCRVWLG